MPTNMDVVYRRNDLDELTSNVPQARVWHSPTGFEVGYGGSGPADFALNILLAFGLLDDIASRLHQDFKRRFIATMPKQEGTIKGAEILDWLAMKSVTVDISEITLLDHQVAAGVSKPEPLPSAERPKWITMRKEMLAWLPYSADDLEVWLAEPNRARSGESDFGCHWRHESELGQAIFGGRRISWIEDTGELYAECQRDKRGIVFDKLFAKPRDIERLMKGWAEEPLQIGCLLNTEAAYLLQQGQ